MCDTFRLLNINIEINTFIINLYNILVYRNNQTLILQHGQKRSKKVGKCFKELLFTTFKHGI